MQLCGSFPWCSAPREPGDAFCAQHRAQMDDIKLRLFGRERSNSATPAPAPSPEQSAAAIARWVAERDEPVRSEQLRKTLGIGHNRLATAVAIARENGWLAVQHGAGGGYVRGDQKPPQELAEPEAA
jgi:hypothetical protein